MVVIGQVREFPRQHIFGGIGWVLLGFGVLSATLARRRDSVIARAVCILAAVAFFAASIAIGIGAWWLSAMFRYLATAESVEPMLFNQGVAGAKIPLLLGWIAVLIGAVLVFAADCFSRPLSSASSNSAAKRTSTYIAVFCCVVFLLACIWSEISNRDLEAVFAKAPIAPSAIAGGVKGLMRSEFLAAIGTFACGCASIMMARETGTQASISEPTNKAQPE